MSELRTLLELAVRDVLDKHRDKNIAVCLSGGVDSSTVASIAAELPVVTGYYNHPACDERDYARLVANGREWFEVQITPDDFVRCFDATAKALAGLPCGPGAVGQYVVAERMADEGFDMLLTGEGGDEMFGGYARLYAVAGKEMPDGYDSYLLPDGYPTALEDALAHEWDALRTLCKVDERVAGAHGIQVVPPMMNPWVVAYAHQLPSFQRVGKVALKDAVRGLVPDPILDRTDKKGFPTPFAWWAQNEPMRSFVQERIGHLPDPENPWDRGWWEDMLGTSALLIAA